MHILNQKIVVFMQKKTKAFKQTLLTADFSFNSNKEGTTPSSSSSRVLTTLNSMSAYFDSLY